MQKIIIFLLVGFVLISTNIAYAQTPSLATFQETAQVVVDKSISKDITASITLQTTSIQEIKIPAELENKIRGNSNITSVVVTNENHCVLGVVDESCILINVKRDPADKGVIAIQDHTKEIADQYIEGINNALDTKAKFNSVFINTDDKINKSLETSGVVSGAGIISAVYTMPMEETGSMYEKISGLLIPKVIRDSGGFYDVATNLSHHENATSTFSIIPMQNNSLLQLKLSVRYPQAAPDISQIQPLGFLGVNELKRSEYFSSGFYPLNSIFQIVVLSPETIGVSNVQGHIVPTKIAQGVKIPTEFNQQGWVFDPEQGQKIQGKYIFGKDTTIDGKNLAFALSTNQEPNPSSNQDNNNQDTSNSANTFDQSIVILAIIIVGGAGAAIFFLKGYKK